MTPRLTAETFCFAPAQTLASLSTVRWSSAVVSTIELACTGVAHKASAALSGLSGQRHGRWCLIRAAPSAGRRGRPTIFFNQMPHRESANDSHATSPRRSSLLRPYAP